MNYGGTKRKRSGRLTQGGRTLSSPLTCERDHCFHPACCVIYARAGHVNIQVCVSILSASATPGTVSCLFLR